MTFYLGTHKPGWLGKTTVPLFLSRRSMPRLRYPEAQATWALDSGGFTELKTYGHWTVTLERYAEEVRTYQREIGRLAWAAPMDYMCEPGILTQTGLSVQEHQHHTIRNYQRLRDMLGPVIIPVLQGWTVDEYQRCWEQYDQAGIDLGAEPVVGVGSICRRNQDDQIGDVIRSLSPLRIHAFGVRGRALADNLHLLTSADSMAWSYAARRSDPLPGHTHQSCANCLPYALQWRDALLTRTRQATPQLRLETA